MYCIGICDDEWSLGGALERKIIEIGKKMGKKLVVEVFSHGEDLLNFIEAGEYPIDLLFLDIMMDGMNGVEVGERIREHYQNETMQVVFVSSSEDYYKELFNIRPLNFLKKPVSSEDLENVLKKAFQLDGISGKHYIYHQNRHTYRVPLTDIMYFVSNNRKISFYTKNGAIFEHYGRLQDVLAQVKDYYFLQVQQSYVINIRHLLRYGKNNVTMSDGTELPLTQRSFAELDAFMLREERDDW